MRSSIQYPDRVILVCMDANVLVQQLGAWSKKTGPLHRRLALALEKTIEEGILLAGTRLPAERKLAQALALSRTTVVTTYDTLRAEGWLESRPGSGTWVAAGRATRALQSAHTSALQGSSIVNVLGIKDSEVVDFAAAITKPLGTLPRHLFSISPDVQEALLSERNYMVLGLPALKDAIARYYRQMGVPTDSDQILVTAGAQQAISLVTGLYVQRGDTVLTENPTYFGALQAFRLAGARLAAVSVGVRHVEAAKLRDRILANGPRLIYLTPTHQNPTGTVMPESDRREVARLSRESGIPVVEDCTVADMQIDGEAPKPIAAFAENGTVLSIGSMSKLYWAGLRVGWVRASPGAIPLLASIKATADLGSPLLNQVIASQLLSAVDQAKALRREELLSRRGLLMELLRKHIPEWTFTPPAGGLCLWIRMKGYDSRHFAQFAARFGVALTPGSMFAADDACNDFLRLPFLLEEEAITAGILRLKCAWDEFRSTASVDARYAAMIV
jgi:DNA-binding transcriptional MocR family regulator